jgi:hypothetical protein
VTNNPLSEFGDGLLSIGEVWSRWYDDCFGFFSQFDGKT